jgi:predicted alpha-1,2-mannosidase
MNFWSPQTGPMGDGWMYTYTADKINGFKQTHQPSPWMNDYGQFAIMPLTGKARWNQKDRASYFSHKSETVKPYYYKVYLADHDVTTEFTATERAAYFRFSYPATDSAWMVIDGFDKGSHIRILTGENAVVGYTTRNSGGVATNFRNYFVIRFNKPFRLARAWSERGITDSTILTSDHTGALLNFSVQPGEAIEARIASSFISEEQARFNLETELGSSSFQQHVAQSKQEWEKILGRVQVSGGTEEQMKTFYSCLYRAVCFPQKHYEMDRNGKPIHYSPYTGQILPGYFYAGTGFWDTFRALYPLLNLFYPSINREMQEGLINAYKEGGFLPEWSSPGFRDVMVGNNSASVVADAYIKGLRGYDINLLYEALRNGAEKEGPLSAVGRKGVEFYNKLGYVPYDVGINENAARSLEYAYNDFTIWQLGKKLGRPGEELAVYEKRMMNYRNLFDPETRLMRGKLQNGSFQKPFNPFKWGDAFTEGNSWHYSWSVFHDIQGLINLMGGEKIFISMLDSVFKMPPVFDDSYYGFPIHEIREMQIINMGQYAHGNQPIQHLIYLYNYAGQPWKTQYRVRDVLTKLYHPGPDGYCGDEDNGQTSAWYVFSALGFYPVCPGTDQYVLGAPLFKKAVLKLENGKEFVVGAPENSERNLYVQNQTLQGKPLNRTYLTHSEIMSGGSMQFIMGAKANEKVKFTREQLPFSISK